MLNKSGESGHPYPVPDHRGKSLFFTLSVMLAVDFLYETFIILRKVPSKPTLLWVFIINGCCTLSGAFLHPLK